VAVCQTLFRSVHHSVWIRNYVVERLDLAAASVAPSDVGWCKATEATKATIAVEAELIFQIGAPQVGWAALVVGDSDLFPGFDEADCVDGFALRITVPAIVSIRRQL
jgi:hypothetical protein